jgi:hypothetical protein
VVDECAVCQWIVEFRRRDLSPMERKGLVNEEVRHRRIMHGERIDP